MNKVLKIEDNVVIHCQTLDLTKIVLEIAQSLGCFGDRKLRNCEGLFAAHKEETCLDFNKNTFNSMETYRKQGKVIMEAEEFILLHGLTFQLENGMDINN